MKNLIPQELAQFARGYRFAGGKLRRVRVLVDGGAVGVEFGLVVNGAVKDLGTDAKEVRLKLRLEGVEEYRFQKRVHSWPRPRFQRVRCCRPKKRKLMARQVTSSAGSPCEPRLVSSSVGRSLSAGNTTLNGWKSPCVRRSRWAWPLRRCRQLRQEIR